MTREKASGTVSVRALSGQDLGSMGLPEFAEHLRSPEMPAAEAAAGGVADVRGG